MSANITGRPLEGIRVLDLTLFLSGPYATQILGDLGAEVLKLEPKDGDQTRHLPPNFVGSNSAYFLSVNRNKKSIQVDYKAPEGLAVLLKLAAQCDVVIENSRPGQLAKYGIDRTRIMAENPGLVWCSISGFGQDGPYAHMPAYDMIVQALSGGMSMTGEPEGKAVRSAIPLGDISAGMYGVIGILSALYRRQGTGVGDFIDVSMLDCQVAMLSYQAAYYLQSSKIPGRQGRGHESVPTYRAFTARDGVDFVVCAITERMWRSLCAVLQKRDLLGDKRFEDPVIRNQNRSALWEILEEIFSTKDAKTWVAALQAAEIPAALVNTLDETFKDPQIEHRGMSMTMSDDAGRKVRVAGDPLKFSASTGRYTYPPTLGAHTFDVLRGVLNLSDEDLRQLEDRNVITNPGAATEGAI